MSRISHISCRTAGSVAAWGVVIAFGLAAAHAQPSSPGNEVNVFGRIKLDSTSLPPATIEVDLSQSMFRDLFGLGDAAVAGVAETLLQSLNSQGDSPEIRLAAEQLEAARQIMHLAGQVVQEVRVRIHTEVPDQLELIESLNVHFGGQLDAGGWDNVVRAREDDESVRVAMLRSDGAIRGLFVIAGSDEGIVLANIVCDVSPENVKKLTSAATKIGLDHGLKQELERQLEHLHRHAHPEEPVEPVDEPVDVTGTPFRQ